MQTEVSIIDNSEAWLKQEEAELQVALGRIAQAALGYARLRVPKNKTLNLTNSGRVKGTGNEREIVFGNPVVRYAGVQEYGEWISGPNAGKKISQYTTKDTGKDYLKLSAERISQERVKPYLP